MKEDFLHYLWRMRKFEHQGLKTSCGLALTILNPGIHNLDAGPDFSNARIRMGDMLWAGNVEIHLKASEWYKHQHQGDKAYDNVILHVVLEDDQSVFRQNGSHIPCLELRQRIPPKLLENYQRLQSNHHWIPCQHHVQKVTNLDRQLWLDRLLVERLEQKTEEIEQSLIINKQDWETSFYQFLARSFGVKVNSEPFEQLAKSLPLSILKKHRDNHFQIEALLFGQAGMLDKTFKDDYPRRLQKEYDFLKKKYKLRAIPVQRWKFLRMRPANFPSVRIAQFARLIYQSAHLFSKVLAAQNITELKNMFCLKISNYWQTHYVFDKPSVKRDKKLGKTSIELLIINTIAPFIFFYGKSKANDALQEKALDWLEALSPEQNKILEGWKIVGFEAQSAYQSQALLQLKKAYCDSKRCTACSIGHAILKA